jgi:hypothetical protein
MFCQIFSSIGSAVGGALGGGILSSIGRFAGKMLGTYLERSFHEPEEYYSFKNIKESFHFSKAVYGQVIPLIFGSMKVNGKIIWSDQIKEIQNTATEAKYFPNSSHERSLYYTTNCEYYLSFALAICEGEISEVSRIWGNGELINLGAYKFRLYLGTEEQMPDPLIIANIGEQAPAFRGLSYIIFEDLPLADFDNSIPNFSFEVIRKANIPINPSVEDLVKSMTMIPGSGEFVYDTIVQSKIISNCYNMVIAKKIINSHNHYNIANAIHSLNQLKITCSNIEWIAPVVCWFGDSLDVRQCSIKPAVENQDENTQYSEEWRVGQYSRISAKLISRDADNNPRYGGSVNDASIMRYLEELKRRNLKIMFYPMFFLDIDDKPWRGHLTGSAADIPEFFRKLDGYNNFILHYARLVKNHVDAFVIGSELIGLTKVRDGTNNFPAVNELLNLARLVKEIVGSNVLVTYAADWSEYHHSECGWYHLDKLWASPDIDFVGIDAYFPATTTISSSISREEIVSGWHSGEGFDYYIDDNNNKQELSAQYAWKNLKYWWENTHINPDGMATEWRPRMKQIWFTEFGFPSIDKATNQPNIFFDPLCRDGGTPKYSSGEIDFSIQRKAIRAFIEYWQGEEYIGNMFLWTWDARPYPAWPHMKLWRDGYLWEKGHWVNNKFGACSLAAIILELSNRCNIKLEKIDVTELDESVEGLIIDRAISAMDTINILRIAYFFDIIANNGNIIKFVKRGQVSKYNINANMLVKAQDNSFLRQQIIPNENIISSIGLYYIDHANQYNNSFCQIYNENFSNKAKAIIRLPIALSSNEAARICQLILKNAAIETQIIKFTLPITFLHLEPTDFISLCYLNNNYQIRIINIKLNHISIEVTGVMDEISSYYLPTQRDLQELLYESNIDSKLLILDLPFIFDSDQPYLAIYLQSYSSQPLYVSLSGNVAENYKKISKLTKQTLISNVVSFDNNQDANIFVIDELSRIVIFGKNFEKFLCADWNLAIWGKEIIRFRCCENIGENLYLIRSIIRGCFATESYINSHEAGESFVLLLEQNINLLPISHLLENKELYFKIQSLEPIKYDFANKSQKLLPVFIKQWVISDNILSIEWVVRTRGLLRASSLHFQQHLNSVKNGKSPSDYYESMIYISSNGRLDNFITNQQILNINITELQLSGEVKITIISKDKQDYYSSPAIIILNI